MPQPDVNKTTKPSKLKNFAKNFSLILLSLIFALSICEITLLFYNPFGFRIKGDNIVLPVNKTEILHHGKCTKIDALVVHHNNSLGFKGPEPPKDFADWLTVVAVGGSTTECLEIAADKTWPYQLGVKLQHDFKKLVAQQCRVLRPFHLRPLHPDAQLYCQIEAEGGSFSDRHQ